MKYENYTKVSGIVKQIAKLNNELEFLNNNEFLELGIKAHGETIITIAAWKDSEHWLNFTAMGFIEVLKTEYQKKLDNLHKELSEL